MKTTPAKWPEDDERIPRHPALRPAPHPQRSRRAADPPARPRPVWPHSLPDAARRVAAHDRLRGGCAGNDRSSTRPDHLENAVAGLVA